MTQPAWNPSGASAPAYGQAPPVAAHGPAWPAAALPAAKALGNGFVAGLFDFSFKTFVAPKVLKVLYGVWIAALVLGVVAGTFNAVYTMIFGSSSHLGESLLMLVALPFVATAWLVVGRVYFELVSALFRIAETLMEMNGKMR